MDRGVKRISLVEIGIHPLSPLSHFQVILRSGQRGHHKERRHIHMNLIHEILDVTRQLLLCIEGKPDDISGVNVHTHLVPLADDAYVLFGFVLYDDPAVSFPGDLEIRAPGSS